MGQLDLPVAEIEHPDRGEGVVGDDDLGLQHLLAMRVVALGAKRSLIRSPASAVCSAATSWAWIGMGP